MGQENPAARKVGIAARTLGRLIVDQASGSSLQQHSSDVLSSVLVKPVFWGSQWFQPTTPSAGEILWAIRSIFKGPYMSGLAQYGVGNGALDPNPVFTGFSPDPPQNFTKNDIEAMLSSLVSDEQISIATGAQQVLAAVFTPVDISSDQQDENGYHTYLSVPGGRLAYAWIGNIGDLDFTSAVFSHELAEGCSDPYLDAVYAADGSCGQAGRCEIADYCYGNELGRGSGVLGGVNVSAYWSIQDGGCILPSERSIPGDVQGVPALVQGRFLSPPGNFEFACPLRLGGLAHYSRVNVDPQLRWFGPETFGQDVGGFDATTMIQSNFTTGGPGNLELVATWQAKLLLYWREDVPPYIWHRPELFPLSLPAAGGVRGNPSMIQGRFGTRGNFELVTPLAAGGLAHYSRDNDDPQLSWSGPAIFAQDLGIVDAAALIQSDFSSSGGGPGNLEVIALWEGKLLHYWRQDAPPWSWSGPDVLPLSAPGQNERLVSGFPSFVESRFGPYLKGYFQVVTPLASGGLAHYTRDNNTPGLPWSGPEIFGTEMGVIDAVTLIQSNFSSSNNGIGNLELVARLGNTLHHFWREDITQIADVTDFSTLWYGPWVITLGADT